jgi:DNA repair photolyase
MSYYSPCGGMGVAYITRTNTEHEDPSCSPPPLAAFPPQRHIRSFTPVRNAAPASPPSPVASRVPSAAGRAVAEANSQGILPLHVRPMRQRRPPLPVLDERQRGTRFVTLVPRSILNSPEQTGMDFWSLNPYVGCEFGCTYCYARFTHRYVVERARAAGSLTDAEFRDFRGPHGWEAFEQRIFVKAQLLGALETDLRRVQRAALHGRSAPIVIGTATDPYQPAERRFRITRSVLTRLARCEGFSFGLITKSGLVARDADLLAQLQRANDVEVHISLSALDPALIRVLEARSPLPAVRLRALARLCAAGVNAGLLIAPVLPGITDDWGRLDALFAAARAAGARFVHASPLRLYPAIRERFYPVLERHFPALAERYRAAYRGRGAAPRVYARALARRIHRLQRRHGFAERDMTERYEKRRPPAQGRLPLGG